MYKLIVFDFDGTIADTSEGIIDSHKFALKKMGVSIPSESELRALIGGNLLKIYSETFGFGIEKAKEAIVFYRNRYSEYGIHKTRLYEGFSDLLQFLKSKDLLIGVATLKSELFAKKMLSEMNIIQYFDIVCGMDNNDTLDKPSLIEKNIKLLNSKIDETLFVGDSLNDYNGALKVGVDFVGVTYGFGFDEKTVYEFETKNSPEELQKYIKFRCSNRSDILS